MEKLDSRLAAPLGREAAGAVPGLGQVMEAFRVAYPELSRETIRRVLRLPPEIKERPESPREV
jgi:hypothetical protein